jgi:disulfide oxidoreductase YuzD
MIPDIFDPSKPHRCPTWGKPETCRCPSCIHARKVMDSRQRLDAAMKRNFAPTGRSFPSQPVAPEPERPKETPREKIERQREERFRESEKTWAYVQANEARYAAHRESVLAKRQRMEVPKFDLDEVLANPELDAVKSVKLDPASMLADDIESLAKEGKEFINNPTLAGAASMAVIAIPGKFADKFSVGSYEKIKGTLPNMDAHHVGQKALMKKFIPNYDLNKAPAILVPKVGHTLRGPNGIVSRKTSGIASARGLIARDIKELRRVYPDIPNSQLKKLIDMNKELYPEAFLKGK